MGEENNLYEIFIDSIKENNELWLLKAFDGLYAMLEDNTGQEYIPVWNSKQKALDFAGEDWEGYSADSMKIYEFVNWLKELDNDEVMIAVSPGEDMHTIPIKASDIMKHLKES